MWLLHLLNLIFIPKQPISYRTPPIYTSSTCLLHQVTLVWGWWWWGWGWRWISGCEVTFGISCVIHLFLYVCVCVFMHLCVCESVGVIGIRSAISWRLTYTIISFSSITACLHSMSCESEMKSSMPTACIYSWVIAPFVVLWCQYNHRVVICPSRQNANWNKSPCLSGHVVLIDNTGGVWTHP